MLNGNALCGGEQFEDLDRKKRYFFQYKSYEVFSVDGYIASQPIQPIPSLSEQEETKTTEDKEAKSISSDTKSEPKPDAKPAPSSNDTEKENKATPAATGDTNDKPNDTENKPTPTNDDKPYDSETKPKKKKKKKKKNTPLYQETAVKYYDGFMKNKRFNKGINLSTGCGIFKTAWELPENNGLILPSRVIRHFKQVLPKKPKGDKKKKKNTKKTPTAKPRSTAPPSGAAMFAASIAAQAVSPSTPTSVSNASPRNDDTDDGAAGALDVRSRTMVDLHIPKDLLKDNNDEISIEDELKMTQSQQRRTMLPTSTSNGNAGKGLIKKEDNKDLDKIENLIEKSNFDEQSLDEATSKGRRVHFGKSASIGQLVYDSADDEIEDLKRIAKLKQMKNIKFTPKADKNENEDETKFNYDDVPDDLPKTSNAKSTTLTVTSTIPKKEANAISLKTSDTPETPAPTYDDHGMFNIELTLYMPI